METNDMVKMLEDNKKRLAEISRGGMTSERKIQELACVLGRINEILLRQEKVVD